MPYSPHGRHIRRLVCLLLLGIASLAIPTCVHAQSPIIIGEVAWAGSSLSTADEWLELWNIGDQPIDLNGYRLIGAGGTDGIPLNGTVQPQSTYIIANYPAEEPKCTLALAPDLVTSATALSNEHLGIQLIDPGGTIIDLAGDGNTPLFGSSGAIKISMVRRNGALTGDDPNAWQDATTTLNIDPNIFDLGTPRFCDGCPPMVSSTQINPPLSMDATSTVIDPPPIDASSSTADLPTVTSTIGAIHELPLQNESPIQNELPLLTLTTSTETTADPPRPIEIRLREIAPDPTSENEWIDLTMRNTTSVNALLHWSLTDAQSLILRFTPHLLAEMQTAKNDDLAYLHIPLPSNHLNNDGDAVFLRNTQNEIMDHTAYPSMKENQRWTRGTNGDENWHIVGEPPVQDFTDATPAVVNATTTVTAIVQTIHAATSTAPHIATKTSAIAAAKNIQTTIVPKTDATKVKTTKPTTKKTTAKTTPVKPKTKTVAAKTKTATPTAIRLAFDDIPAHMNDLPLLVRIQGTVGTVPGLLSTNQFVIHTADGRGLLVRGNGKQPSPPFQTTIEVTGTLTSNDQGISLGMLSKDRWKKTTASQTVTPRTVDLLAPDMEDAWSLVEVTGTVKEIKPTRVTLDVGETDLVVQIRPIIKYRSQRLLVGDTVRVRGVIDIRNEQPKLFPRQADDIFLAGHASPKTNGTNTSQMPPWSPIAAAGGTIAIGQGWKRIRKAREQRRLKKLLVQASETMQNI